ncbi:hypothetical protein LUD75_15720 [Epilithonimonas sp. JDS]|uniref:hypothetical protein n=1 Tax=Epilithonimonas sp. JDS TaxID=2902797 RepID=UPI001E33863C|nr:hypothetical protein [Epilithonimonas sp. JDS]MCD9856174.1 hypothetical protein [Epilithonimonas sp. JDS]
MKKYFIMVAGFLAANSYGQCTIAGNSTIKINENASYSVDAKAQCEDCYSWKLDQNLKTDGNLKSGVINVQALKIGKQTLSVSVFNVQSLQCEKTIEVVDDNQSVAKNKCGVNIDDFKEIKVNDSVISFFPNENSSDYSYEWMVTYANGEVKNSSEKIPQFFFSEINYVKLVKLKIINKIANCTVSISKNYDQYYWKPTTTVGKIEQKVYSPVSYSDYIKSSDRNKIERSDKDN